MASSIRPYQIPAPGYWGLNTEDSPIGLDNKFALQASNCVIDKSGRIASRKGITRAHATYAEYNIAEYGVAEYTGSYNLGTSSVQVIGEVVETDGTATLVTLGGGYVFKIASSTLTTLTYGGGGVAPTLTLNNWQFCQLGGVGVVFQRGYDPLIFDPAVSTTTFRRLSEKTGYTGTVPLANCGLSAYGRLWAADTSTNKNTVYWSDTLTTHNWTAGTSGTLNLLGVWPSGGDEITALAAHNNFLIIFGRKQILIYSGANNPATMVLADSIANIGCIARDSVQNTGEDILFLSDSGVRSLERTIQEKSAPLRGVSKNVFTDLKAYLDVETVANIKSAYSPTEAFYLLTFPASQITYCFDMRAPLPDGSARATTWEGVASTAFCYSKSRDLYLGRAGFVGKYSGYSDNGSAYRMKYAGTWVDFGEPIQTTILKNIRMDFLGVLNQSVTVKWGFDFNAGSLTTTSFLTGIAASVEYGSAEFGISEYQGGGGVAAVNVNGSGSGKVLQTGFEANINGYTLSAQKIELITKDGRL